MMNSTHKEIARICYVKEGRTYKQTYKETDPAEVNKALMHDLINKKLHGCKYITSIKDRCNYDGTRTITVYYDNGVKNEYTVEA